MALRPPPSPHLPHDLAGSEQGMDQWINGSWVYGSLKLDGSWVTGCHNNVVY
jgi:hypothetical protein